MDLILNLFSLFLSIGGFIAGGIAILFVLMAIFSTSDPNEMEAKKYGWDTWTPHDPLNHGADMTVMDHVNNFNGDMNSIGCIFDYTNELKPAWFNNKEDFLEFIESSYLYITPTYLNRDPENCSLENIDSTYEKTVVSALSNLGDEDDWGVDDVKKILNKFFKNAEEDFQWFTFKSICYEKDDINRFREDFRSFQDREPNTDPIKTCELEDFKQYIAQLAEY
ncbi:hypothetical protein OAI21_00210 [Oceanospirillaceae bacterium]|nr:hypothetical protein [Oceanospirillaceae bacterium]